MSAQPTEPGGYEIVEREGAPGGIVPLEELRVLRALREQASPEALRAAEEAAELELEGEILNQHRDWVARGRPGARSHDDVMNELLAPSGGWTPPSRGR
jgi:hypothetical protein